MIISFSPGFSQVNPFPQSFSNNRFNGFRFSPTHKPLKRFLKILVGNDTRLKPGVNEINEQSNKSVSKG